MSMTPTGIARTIGLWILIVCSIASIVIDFIMGSIWAWVKISLFALIIAWEIINYIRTKKTISTEQKVETIQNRVLGYLSLFLFALSLAGLILHLAVW